MKLIAFFALLLCGSSSASELIDPDVFFAPPRIASVAIAPDSSRLAALRRVDQHNEVHIYTLGEDSKVRAESGFGVSDYVRQVSWLTSKHVGIWSEQRLIAHFQGVAIPLPGAVQVLYSFEAPDGNPIELYASSGGGNPVVARVEDSEHHVLIHNSDRKYGVLDLHKVDLRDGSSTLVARGKKKTRNYLLHPEDGSILRLDQTPGKSELLRLRAGKTNKWKVLHKVRGKSASAEFNHALRSLYGQTTMLVRERADNEEYHQLVEYNLLDPDYRAPAVRMDGHDIIETIRAPLPGLSSASPT